MEQTQATAPAPAQAQQPVHPIHQETADLESLTKWVQENPDNDPHEGTDLEAPKAPPKEGTAPEAPKEEAKTEDVPAIEIPEDEPLFDLEYKTDSGKEQKKLSLKELREGYLAKQDYHRNIQKVQKERAEVAEQAKQAGLKAASEYAQRLEIQKQAVTKLAGVKSLPEIEALSRQDPAAAQQEFLKLLSVNQTVQAIENEQRAVLQKLDADRKEAKGKAIERSRQALKDEIPNWSEELYGKVLGSMVSDYGLNKQGVEEVAEAELIKVFHDAYQYRQLQKAKPEVSKRVVAIPKVVKPGSAEKPNPAKDATDKSYERLKKSGRGEDFVSWYMNKNK